MAASSRIRRPSYTPDRRLARHHTAEGFEKGDDLTMNLSNRDGRSESTRLTGRLTDRHDLRAKPARRPTADDGLRHPCNQHLAFVLRGPGGVLVVVGERSNDYRAIFCIDDADVIAHTVEAAGLVGDMAGHLGCVGVLEIVGDAVAP